VGAVDFENPLNRFYMECRIWEGAHISDEALRINGFSRAEAVDIKKPFDRDLVTAFLKWAHSISERTIAGQNPSTDRDFLKATAERYHIDWPFAHRVVDLHSVMYFELILKGKGVPTKNGHSSLHLDSILTYVGIPEEPKPHNGLTGALVETEAFGRLFYGKNLISDFEKYPVPSHLIRR
jgi:DNA polymerase III epsilon subunit-like protein